MTAVINHVSLIDPDTSQIYETIVNPERDILLNGYTIQAVNLNIQITDTKLFGAYPLEIQLIRVQGSGDLTGSSGQPLVNAQFPAHIRLFAGRVSNVAVRLDDTMFASDGTFDQDTFLANNTTAETGGTVNSYLADYLMFDISSVTSGLPQLPSGNGSATRVYFTGDNYAVSTTSPGEFDVLTPIGFVEGTFRNPTRSGPISTPGIFTLVQPDPRDPDPNTARRITALQGIWKDVSSTVGNMGDFTALSLPSSEDNNFQTVLFIQQSGGVITEMYFGLIDYTAGTIAAYPINQVSPGSTLNEIDGTVTNLLDKNGLPTSDPSAVRSGTFSLVNGTGTVPGTFPTTGKFIVYRR